MELVELARLTPSAANLQPIKYLLSSESVKNDKIFPHLGWAGYLADWSGPIEAERPSAYLIILGDTTIAKSFHYDLGIVAQTIMLGATEKGLGGCMIANLQKEKLCKELAIPEQFEILLVLALGKPVEEVTIESLAADGSVKYWRDENGGHHVPKRQLAEIIIDC